ncbi:MAG: DUF116 domain-containing protein [Thermodesulfovibrionales bacterium]|nr:DUF116 domain-containing protein [Thermodesulfovibrionales bacterium]
MASSYRIMRGFVLKMLYPVFMFIGVFFKSKKESLQSLIIRLNNLLVRLEKISAKKILLLLPHCIQINECAIRLTHNIKLCRGCGRCEIKDLIEIGDRYGINLFVATGGTLARRIVRDVMPEAIVAVACERDLSSGMVDTYPLPVIGIPNERPFGPCMNTRVDLSLVKEAIEFLSYKKES